jgi:NAD(P)-dependent dehydrogenase (short-subunit alcohol dehydrogenase family)
VRVVVVGASSGLGRCIGVGLAQRGANVALLARRRDRLDRAVEEAGDGAVAIECDVTDAASSQAAIDEAASTLGGIDAVIYSPGIGPLARIEETDVDTWRRVFDTNVTGASVITAAALPHLKESEGRAIYLSSVSASMTPPWPGLGSYAVSKAALDKLVEAWRAEHPVIGFTRLVVGDCAGGEGEGMTGFAEGWDPELATEVGTTWFERGYLAGVLLDADELVAAVDGIVQSGPTVAMPTVVVMPRPVSSAVDPSTLADAVASE